MHNTYFFVQAKLANLRKINYSFKANSGLFSARTWTQHKICWILFHVESCKAFLGRADAQKNLLRMKF